MNGLIPLDLSSDNYSCGLQHGVEEDLAVFVQLKPFSSLDKLALEFLSNYLQHLFLI